MELTKENVIKHDKVYDLLESAIAAAYPMMEKIYDDDEYYDKVFKLDKAIKEDDFSNRDLKRFIRLGSSDGGHDNFLNTVIVNFTLTVGIKVWTEIERYKFVNFNSSQSTMHRLCKMEIAECTTKYADKVILERLQKLIDEYNNNPTEENFLIMTRNCPVDLVLTARLSTNYRCLKNMYFQRKEHRQPEWKIICEWIRTLPLMDLILTKAEEKKKPKVIVLPEEKTENK